MSYRVTYGQLGNERDLFNPEAGVYLISGKASFESNVSPTLKMELPPNHPLLGRMEPMSTDMEVRLYEDGEELLRGRIITDGDDLDKVGSVEVEDQQAYLNDVSVRPYATYYVDDQKDQLPIVSGNLAQHLIEDYNAHCTAGREFSFLGSEIGDDLRVSTTQERSVRDELADTIYAAGAYISVKSVGERRTVEFLVNPPHGSQPIRVGSNLISYDHSADYSGIVTAIIAKGKGSPSEAESDDSAHEEEFGLETISDGDYGAIRIDGDRAISVEGERLYGIIEERRSYECATPQGLFELVERDLANSILDAESIDVTAHDLHELNPDIEPLRLNHVYTIEPPQGAIEMMLTQIDLDICDPAKSTYHFGRLASSLSRTGVAESAAGRTTQRDVSYEANRERTKTKHLIDGLDEIGDGIIDLKQDFNTEVDGLRDLVDAGTEQAGQRMDQLEETLGGRIGDLDEALGRTEKRIDGVEGRSEELDAAIKSAAQQAMEALYSSVYYGTCSTAAETATKVVTDAAAQNGKPFTLQKGVMLIITFANGNSASAPKLNVNSTGAKSIVINGTNTCYWSSGGTGTGGQTVGFIYDGASWTTPSSSVWTANLLLGNPLGFNLWSDGAQLGMRYGTQQYITMGGSGIQVGFTGIGDYDKKVGTRNIYIGSDKVALRQGQTDYLTLDPSGVQVGMDDYSHVSIGSSSVEIVGTKGYGITFSYDSKESVAKIDSPTGLAVDGGTHVMTFGNNYGNLAITLGSVSQVVALHCGNIDAAFCSFGIGLAGYYTNNRQWVMRSIVVNNSGYQNLAISTSQLGINSPAGYSWSVTNGDWSAREAIVLGTSYYSGNLYVHFDRSFSGNVRLNILGVPVGAVYQSNDPGQEGPEIFDDPETGPGPQIIDDQSDTDSDQEAA